MRTATVQIYLVCFRMIESKVTLHCFYMQRFIMWL